MAFNRMRRRPMNHGFFAQTVDQDFGWIAQGSVLVTASYQPYLYGPLVTMQASAGPNGNTPVASIQRTAAGTFTCFLDSQNVGEKLVGAWADIITHTAGFQASYDAYVGSYTAPPPASTGSYTGGNVGFGRLTIYTQSRATASLGGFTDISSLAVASIRIGLRWSDADY
jgi:hypothetical protein